MANRSYLYATDHLRGAPLADDNSPVGVSEWSNEIPFVYKLLLSPAPSAYASPINPILKTAICGDYEKGVARFEGFTKKICTPAAEPLIGEALQHLKDNKNKREHFVLECFEIFDLQEEFHEIQTVNLLEELKTVGTTIETHAATLNALADKSDSALLEAMHKLGFGFWSNTLYLDISNHPQAQLHTEDNALSHQWLAEQKQKDDEYLAYFSCQIEVIADESLAFAIEGLTIYIDGNVNRTRRGGDKPQRGEFIRIEPGEHRIVIREPFDRTKESRLESNTLHFSLRKGDTVRFVATSKGDEISLSQERNISRAERRRNRPFWLIAITERFKGFCKKNLKQKD